MVDTCHCYNLSAYSIIANCLHNSYILSLVYDVHVLISISATRILFKTGHFDCQDQNIVHVWMLAIVYSERILKYFTNESHLPYNHNQSQVADGGFSFLLICPLPRP